MFSGALAPAMTKGVPLLIGLWSNVELSEQWARSQINRDCDRNDDISTDPELIPELYIRSIELVGKMMSCFCSLSTNI